MFLCKYVQNLNPRNGKRLPEKGRARGVGVATLRISILGRRQRVIARSTSPRADTLAKIFLGTFPP
jgi:hypothetical protein